MNKNILNFTFIICVLITQFQLTKTIQCKTIFGGCSIGNGNCVQNECIKCDNGNDINSECRCKTGEFYIKTANKCQPCNKNCLNCTGPSEKECSSCQEKEGYELNRIDLTCECIKGYVQTNDLNNPCQHCYNFQNACVPQCPPGLIPDDKQMICISKKKEDVKSNDSVLYIITMIFVMAVSVMLVALLVYFILKILNQIRYAKGLQQLPLTDEESDFMKIQIEADRVTREKEEEIARQLALEEEERRKEEERLRLIEEERLRKEREQQEAKKHNNYDNLTTRTELDDAYQLLSGQNLQRKKNSKVRQKIWDWIQNINITHKQNLNPEKLSGQSNILLKNRPPFREIIVRKLERERLEQLRLEEERRQRELEKERRIQEIEKKKLQRQIVRQETMARNEKKIQQFVEQKNDLINEKQELVEEREKCIEIADQKHEEAEDIKQKINKFDFKKQETVTFRSEVVSRQASIQEKKLECEEELKNVDLDTPLQQIRNMKSDDISFLQSLKNPTERIRLCLEAVLMTLNNKKPESWDEVKKELSNANLKRRIMEYTPDDMSDKIYNKLLKEYISNVQWDVSKISKASTAAGTFANWLDGVIKYKKIKMQNQPLFQKMKCVEIEELEMEENMKKIEDFDNEEIEFERQKPDLERKIEDLLEEEIVLREKADKNLVEIGDKDIQINAAVTDEISLEEIQESDEDRDIFGDDDEDIKSELQEVESPNKINDFPQDQEQENKNNVSQNNLDTTLNHNTENYILTTEQTTTQNQILLTRNSFDGKDHQEELVQITEEDQ